MHSTPVPVAAPLCTECHAPERRECQRSHRCRAGKRCNDVRVKDMLDQTDLQWRTKPRLNRETSVTIMMGRSFGGYTFDDFWTERAAQMDMLEQCKRTTVHRQHLRRFVCIRGQALGTMRVTMLLGPSVADTLWFERAPFDRTFALPKFAANYGLNQSRRVSAAC